MAEGVVCPGVFGGEGDGFFCGEEGELGIAVLQEGEGVAGVGFWAGGI